MTQAGEAEAAILSLDGTIQNGRVLRVNEARPKLARDANSNLSGDSGGIKANCCHTNH
jgi:RNA recognition motif-containing protein